MTQRKWGPLSLFDSRKFWITAFGCGICAAIGQPQWIPKIILGYIGSIALEDAAEKHGKNTDSAGSSAVSGSGS